MTITRHAQVRAHVDSAPIRFVRQEYFPEGWEVSLAQFLELFHRYAYIYRPLAGGSWYSADEKWRLSDSEILKAIACVHPKFLIGCRAGKASRYAVLDIDAKSKYHTKPQLDKLLSVLAEAGLTKSSLYRSSFSDGWHLYLFFDEPISSTELRRQLVKLLTLHDFDIAKGTLEVFPHRSDGSLGMGLRLPLQPGFAWLNKYDLEVDYERSELGAPQALELFIDALEADANSYATFRQLKVHVQELETRRAKATAYALDRTASNVVPLRRTADSLSPAEFGDFVVAVFGQLPPGIIADNWYKGRLFHLNGLSGPSQRAESITCVGHYFFYGDPSRNLPAMGYGYEQEREWALHEFLSVRHNGYSKDINDARPDALAQVERAARWRPSHRKIHEPVKYSPTRPISWIRENIKRKDNARQRIQDALDRLKQLQRAFTTVELQEAADCSRTTLYKHQDIWRAVYEDRKGYRDLSAGFFAICTHEYNVAVGADSSEIKPPPAISPEFTPPGLLASRRVAYEIAMRREREHQQRHQAAVRAQDAAEKVWHDNVTKMTVNDFSVLSLQELKALLVVLLGYLAMAPTEESQQLIYGHINQVRALVSQAEKPLFLVRPP